MKKKIIEKIKQEYIKKYGNDPNINDKSIIVALLFTEVSLVCLSLIGGFLLQFFLLIFGLHFLTIATAIILFGYFNIRFYIKLR